jgi:hypothetical protein
MLDRNQAKARRLANVQLYRICQQCLDRTLAGDSWTRRRIEVAVLDHARKVR